MGEFKSFPWAAEPNEAHHAGRPAEEQRRDVGRQLQESDHLAKHADVTWG
jgi:hypothetical protein